MSMRMRSVLFALFVGAIALVSTISFAANMTPEASVGEQWRYAFTQLAHNIGLRMEGRGSS